MHKFPSSDTHLKFCPIVSSIDTFNINLARFLSDLLSPLILDDYSSKDTFSFASQIKNVNLSCKFLATIFTNIPLQQTIDTATNLVFIHNLNLNIIKKELKNSSFHRLVFFSTINFEIKLIE